MANVKFDKCKNTVFHFLLICFKKRNKKSEMEKVTHDVQYFDVIFFKIKQTIIHDKTISMSDPVMKFYTFFGSQTNKIKI